jgi:hypothetical protein
MTRILNKSLTIPAMIIGVMAVVILFVFWNAQAGTVSERANFKPSVLPGSAVSQTDVRPASSLTPIMAPTPDVPATVAKCAMLDSRRRFALGMIETGNNDLEIGRLGEVSRYQIMPSVWKHYSSSRYYQDPEVSLTVAQQHWNSLHASFKKQANREPTDFDMYVLWNTTYGYYANRGFKPARLHQVVRERAERFVNLVERGETLVARLGPI